MADSVQAAAVNFPPGFRFRPSDEEIVGFYLKNKVQGIKFEFDVIREIDLYKCEPWDLPEKSYLPTRDPEWYFFCPRDRKYPNGSRSNRATVAGYWKATGKDRKVSSRSNKIGTKKTLVFYRGRAPHGERTDWLMHEYRLEGSQLKGGTNLQDLYVLSRVFRKTKQGLNNQEPNQEVCLPISNNPLSPTDVSDGDIEDQSEERSSPAKQEEDTLARSETSSEILDNKVEDNNCIDGPVESFQDISNPSRNLDDPQQGNQDLQYGPFYIPWEEEVDFQQILSGSNFANNDNLPGNQMNSSGVDSKAFDGNYHGAESFDDDLPFLLDGFGNLFEVDAYLFPMTMEEGNNDEPCVAGLPTSMPDDNVHIHIRSRPQSGQSHQQPLPSQGTAKRRVRMGVYRTEEPPDGKEEHPLTVNAQSAFSDDSDDSDESEVITQHEDSLLEDDADSHIFNDSVESSERLANGHDLNLAPTQLLASLVLPIGEASEKSEMPVNSKESGDESVLIEKSQSVMSSGCSQSLSLAAALIPTIVRDESGSPKEHFNDLTGNDLFTSLKREQALIGESEQVQKCIVSENESRLKAPGQVCELIEDSLKGEKLACGISSTEVQMEMTISGTSSQEMELVSVKSSALGTESPTVLASKKVTASEVAASFGLGRLGATGSNNNAVAETHMSRRGSGKFTGFNFIFSGLKLRGKSRAKSSDHVEESRNVTEDFSDRCSKDSWKVFSSLEKVLGISIQPSQLQSKTSKGANCILLICLLSTALLVLFMWNKWHLTRSSSSFILQQRS